MDCRDCKNFKDGSTNYLDRMNQKIDRAEAHIRRLSLEVLDERAARFRSENNLRVIRSRLELLFLRPIDAETQKWVEETIDAMIKAGEA